MRASLVCLALRQPLIKFRHGVCNQISASKSNAAALKLSNPSPKAALEVKMPHVVKPLGPGVTVVAYKNVKELPAHLHRKAISHDEMTIINAGGAVDPPGKPDKKKSEKKK